MKKTGLISSIVVITLFVLNFETKAQNVGNFYGSIDGTESIDLNLGKNGSGSSFNIYSSDLGGSSYLRMHARRYGAGFIWSRESSGGIDRKLAYMYAASSGTYYQLFDHNQTSKIQFHSNGASYLNGGNVGIGTTTPDYKLHIEGTPWTGIKIQDVTTSGGRGIQNKYLDGNNDGWTMYFGGHYSGKPLRFAPISQGTQGGVAFTILNGGNVGIGTDTPSNKLDVAGTIRAEEVKVETGWADYVFKEDYNLKSLDEVSNFISENGHLPNIPTAKEVKENGIKLGEMNAKLLEKIEELTLYLIELNSQFQKQNEKIEKQQKEIEIQRQKINNLKNDVK